MPKFIKKLSKTHLLSALKIDKVAEKKAPFELKIDLGGRGIQIISKN